MQDNNQDNQRKIYIRNTKTWVSVTEEVYREYYRPIWHTQNEKRKNHCCSCPKSKKWRCDGDCGTCCYHRPENGNCSSLDAPIKSSEGDDICLRDTIADPNGNFENILLDKLLLTQLLYELGEHDPQGRRICELIMDGCSKTEIAETLQQELGGNWYKSKTAYHEKQALDWLRKRLLELM